MALNTFFSMIFEWGGLAYKGNFSNDLYQEQLYTTIGLITVITSFFLVIAFYFIINRPSFSQFRHWLIMLLINFVIAFLVGFIIPQNVLYGIGIKDEYKIIEYITFGLITAITSTFFFLIWTYLLKWWYGNAKGTPKLFLGKF